MRVLASQIIEKIRYQLKIKNINNYWCAILMKTNTQNSVLYSLINDANEKIVIKTFCNPTADAKEIYKALNCKQKPYVKKYFLTSQY